MRCICKDPKCTTEVRFDLLSKKMVVESNNLSILVYLDPNVIVDLITELRKCLMVMVNGDVSV
jgi:hypothetical protein